MKKISYFVAILVVILAACEKTPDKETSGEGGETPTPEFDLVDFLLKNEALSWEEDSMTFIYKGEKYTSRYGTINQNKFFPQNAYSNCRICEYLMFEKKELNTLYQSFCSSPFFIKIIDDEGVVKYYNESAFGHNPDPEDGILRFNVAKSFTNGIITYYEEYQGKIFSSRWYTNNEGMPIMEDNEANIIYQKFNQTPCRALIMYQDKMQTLVMPEICE